MRCLIAILITIIICSSCKDNSDKTIINEVNDTIKTFENGKLKSVLVGDKKLTRYYENGNLFSKGYVNDNKRYGTWKFYKNNGMLSEIREYKLIDSFYILNSNRYFSEDQQKDFSLVKSKFNNYNGTWYAKDTLKYLRSNYVEFDLGKDTIKISEPWRAVAFYYTPRFDNSAIAVVLPKDKFIFNKKFSNIMEVEKDTFFSLSVDIKNKNYFPDDNHKTTVVFGKWFEDKGKKNIRGYLSEYKLGDNQKITEHRVYFEKEVIVIDSVAVQPTKAL